MALASTILPNMKDLFALISHGDKPAFTKIATFNLGFTFKAVCEFQWSFENLVHLAYMFISLPRSQSLHNCVAIINLNHN
jgi:hypothetical protein